MHCDVLSVVSCLSSVEFDCDDVFDAVAVADVELTIDAVASVFCVPLAFAISPCSNAVDAAKSTLFTDNLLCTENKTTHKKEKEMKRKKEGKRIKRRTIQNYQKRIYIMYILQQYRLVCCMQLIVL